MDGTFYLDTDVLDGALDFLEEVKKAGKRYVFFTNKFVEISENIY